MKRKIIRVLLTLVFALIVIVTPILEVGASGVNTGQRIIKIVVVKNGIPTVLEGSLAEEYLKNHEEKIISEDISKSTNDVSVSGSIGVRQVKWYYKYIEEHRDNEYHRSSLKKRVSRIVKNNSSTTQTYKVSYTASQKWTINSSIKGKFKDIVEATLGASWTKSYSIEETLQVSIAPKKQMYVTFYPIMKYSRGKSEKWCKSVGSGSLDMCFESKDVYTYSPRYIENDGKKLLDGVYAYVEDDIA